MLLYSTLRIFEKFYNQYENMCNNLNKKGEFQLKEIRDVRLLLFDSFV